LEYPATPLDFLLSEDSGGSADIAPRVTNSLIFEGLGVDRGRKFVFICHSFGGILVKRLLLQWREQNDGYRHEECAGILFLGTPHFGADAGFRLALRSLAAGGARGRSETDRADRAEPGS
jgi:triacylglycerol esterase/lipase EstA (alpha/beta hydrolase family)